MRCPVCKAEINSSPVCPQCGFDKIQLEFINQEEAEHWRLNVLEPYRQAYEQKQVAIGSNWDNVFYADNKVKYLFDVTIPAAILQDNSIGHVLFICPNGKVADEFIKKLTNSITPRTWTTCAWARSTRTNEIAATLSSLSPGAVLCKKGGMQFSNQDRIDLVKDSMLNFSFDIIIGKGIGARSLRLDIAPFTMLVCADKLKQIDEQFVECFDTIIEFDLNEKICALIGYEFATELGLHISEEAVKMIASLKKKDIAYLYSNMKKIADYLLIQGNSGEFVTEACAKAIITLFEE